MENLNLHLVELTKINGEQYVSTDVPLKQYTSFKIGGPADIMVFPPDTESLINTVRYLYINHVNRLLVGNGTNLLVSDKGFRGVVVHTGKNLRKVTVQDEIITAQCGSLLSAIASVALNNCLGGCEFASGIPGTLGGALFMNAGAYGSTMCDIVVSTKALTQSGEVITIQGCEHDFGYRSSVFRKNELIAMECIMEFKNSDYDTVKGKMKELTAKRKSSQPLEYPSAGSAFKRPVGYYAGKLIQDSGLKGYSIGGACVSEKHAGFIINTGNATANDVSCLIEHIISEVNKKFGVVLEPEIIRIGEF